MKKINIEITKAQIVSFSVELKKDKPEVTATIGLFTTGGKQITSYSIMTNHWEKEQTFDLPPELISPILGIMETLEKVIVKKCKDSQLKLK